MGIFDRFRYRDNPADGSGPAEVEGPSTSGLDLQPSSELLRDADAASLGAQLSLTSVEGRLYNPYEGLNTAVDPRTLKNVYRLPKQPEYLFSEEATVHRRSWSENLTYYTGTGYLSGAILGGSQGALQALRSPPQLGLSESTRLRLNRLLNMSGRSGRSAGNALGILGLFFSSAESGLGYLADGRVPDAANSLGAGFATGALYRSTRGPRAAAVAGAVGTCAAAALLAARSFVSKSL